MSTFYFIVAVIIGLIILNKVYKYNKKQKLKEEEQAAKLKSEVRKNEKIVEQLAKVNVFEAQMEEVKKLEIADVYEYKNIVISNEAEIVSKGGDKQLFTFLKVDTFLKDFKNSIEKDVSFYSTSVSPQSLRNEIKAVDNRSQVEILSELVQHFDSLGSGGQEVMFENKLEKLVKAAHTIKPMINNEILTLEYYKSISTAMVIFYLNDKKVRYFEIYEAFEKLGIFDSTWQKDVLGKLSSIDERLATMNNGLIELNRNFISLAESSDNIVAELKEINSSVQTGNLLQGITAYQTWRLNRKLVS